MEVGSLLPPHDQTQVARLAGKHLYLLNYLSSPRKLRFELSDSGSNVHTLNNMLPLNSIIFTKKKIYFFFENFIHVNTIISVVTRLKANVLIYAVDIPCMPALPQSLSQTDGGRMHGCTVLLRFKGFPRAYDVFLSPETHHIVQKAFWTTPHLLRASLWWGWGMPSHHPSLHWR